MRAKTLLLVLAIVAALLAVVSYPRSTPATELSSQDYRTSQFAARTGWMTFRELRFANSGR